MAVHLPSAVPRLKRQRRQARWQGGPWVVGGPELLNRTEPQPNHVFLLLFGLKDSRGRGSSAQLIQCQSRARMTALLPEFRMKRHWCDRNMWSDIYALPVWLHHTWHWHYSFRIHPRSQLQRWYSRALFHSKHFRCGLLCSDPFQHGHPAQSCWVPGAGLQPDLSARPALIRMLSVEAIGLILGRKLGRYPPKNQNCNSKFSKPQLSQLNYQSIWKCCARYLKPQGRPAAVAAAALDPAAFPWGSQTHQLRRPLRPPKIRKCVWAQALMFEGRRIVPVCILQRSCAH